MKKKILIDGMSCEHCVKAVTEALSKIDGVSSVEVSLEEKNATIQTDAEVSDISIKAAIVDAGYTVIGIEV